MRNNQITKYVDVLLASVSDGSSNLPASTIYNYILSGALIPRIFRPFPNITFTDLTK